MGKVQSKQGECFVVNAHLNQAYQCQLEDSGRKLQLTTKHGLTCSELSFAMSNEGEVISNQKAATEGKFPLKVILPTAAAATEMDEDSRPEKAEEEKSEKEEKGKLARELSCDVSVENLDKQEFCFTFYDFNGHGKVTKDDVTGLVRSIYDALRKSVKLPPSGSRTIKVRLAVTPDDESPPKPCPGSPVPNLSSAHTVSTYVSSSTTEKSTTPVVSPATCRKSSPQHEFGNRSPDNRHQHHHNHHYDGVPQKHKHHHRHSSSRDHFPECRDRRNHYLDLAGIENCANKCEAIDPRYMCPFRILDRSHECGKRVRDHPAEVHFGKKHTPSDRFLKYNFFSDARDDLLNLNFDLCDLVPDEKFDWERFQHHRRSKSYDVYETGLQDHLNSPRTKPRPLRNVVANFSEKQPEFPSSPNHHHRHRHRDRERQRAMKQVASWIEREHLGSPNKNDRPDKPHVSVERHEHHHRHEHVHHHYHHYVDC